MHSIGMDSHGMALEISRCAEALFAVRAFLRFSMISHVMTKTYVNESESWDKILPT